MRRLIGIPVAIIAVAFVLVIMAAAFVEGLIFVSGLLGLQHALGIDTQASKNYDSVSGYLPIIVTSLGFSGLLITAWHHLNCHQDGCWRIARFPVAGSNWKTCKPHNPDPAVKSGLTAKHFATAQQKGST